MNSQRKSRPPRNSRWILTLRLRWSRSWTSWRRSRALRSLQRERQREILLALSLDSSRLRVKELEQRHQQLEHRGVEMEASSQFRRTGLLLPATPSTPELDQALGLSTPQP